MSHARLRPSPVFRSIRWRLQLWYGLLMAALLVAFAATAYELERSRRLEQIDAELERLAVEFNLGNRQPTPASGGTPRDGPPPGPGGRRPGVGAPRSIAQIYTNEHAARGIYYTLWSRGRGFVSASENSPPNLEKPGGRGLRWSGTRREAFIEGNPGDVALAGRDVAANLGAIRRFGWKMAAAAISGWVTMLLIGSWLVGRALRPIHEISVAAQKIATGDLSRRINTRDTDSELGQLAGVLNSTFSRLEASFAQQARFTADAAHELRTPVTVMLTHVQNGLGSEALAPDQRAAFEACQRAAQRMRKLIEALLALARLDAGQEPMKTTPLDLASVASECVELVRSLAEKRSVALHVKLESAPCRGDELRLEQVLTNLLTNAIHHNRDGGEVRVRTGRENGEAFFVVADNGPGIAAEHLPHIFDRFYRVDQARTNTGRTGLGLAISHAIIVAHGGTLSVESKPGAGATFTVRLRAA